MTEKGIDALFVAQPSNVWYVAGFWEFIPIRMEAVLIPASGDCVFVVAVMWTTPGASAAYTS